LTEAIHEDHRATTHPIQVTVNNTNEAANVFDKICYRKGAFFLRQIAYYLGDTAVKEAIKNYLQTFSYKTAEFKDFIKIFNEEY
jgi:aminopeptidase N